MTSLGLMVLLAASAAAGQNPPEVLPGAAAERLANGLTLVHLPSLAPASPDWIEIAFGYTSGLRDETGESEGAAAVTAAALEASPPARAAALTAHLGGGVFEFVSWPDQTGVRLGLPRALAAPALQQAALYLAQTGFAPELFDYARDLAARRARGMEGDAETAQRIRAVQAALLDGDPGAREGLAGPAAMARLDAAAAAAFFRAGFGTDRAYVIASEPLSGEAREWLEAIPARPSAPRAAPAPPPASAATALDFPSRPQGGAILATLVPSVHFETWFRALVMDRLLRELEPEAVFHFGPARSAGLHRIEIPVALPRYAEDARDGILSRLRQVELQGLDESSLGRARARALDYLMERSMLEWFAAHGLWEALQNGWNSVRSMRAAEARAAARDFLRSPRATGVWAPRLNPPTVTVESLGGAIDPEAEEPPETARLTRAPGVLELPDLDVPAMDADPVRVEKLASGLTLAASDRWRLFVAGRFDAGLPGARVEARGASGVVLSFGQEPGGAALDALAGVRPERLLLFAPEAAMDAARRRFSGWESGRTDASPSLGAGDVATMDVPGLLILKMWLDARLIEAGWWGLADLRIEGVEGSRLVIDAEPALEAEIRSWIARLGEAGLETAEFEPLRAAATGYFERIRPELQIILWQRAPAGAIPSPAGMTRARFLDVVKTYF